MNKKQFEHIENRVREAAENISPPFSEDAWEAMEKLLNKKTDAKRRRKVLIFWLGPLVGLTVASAIYFLHTRSVANNVITQKQLSIFNSNSNSTSDLNSGSDLILNSNSDKTYTPNLSLSPISIPSFRNSNVTYPVSRLFETQTPEENKFLEREPNEKPIEKENAINNETNKIMADSNTINHSNEMTLSDITTKTTQQKNDIKINKPKPVSRFYFIGAVGMDNNEVKLFSSSARTIAYGIGIGYRVTKRLSLQTGLYASKKKYVAKQGEYKVEPGSYLSTVELKSIDADCYVLDIPLNIRYDVIQRNKYQVYGAAGVSSYIMKTEDYHYYYEKNGAPHDYSWTYKGNRHFLSVTTFSAGYERKLSNSISILVEPYLKVPLTGIGEGKVKLHSSGLLLGIKWNPLKRKESPTR